MIGPVTRRQKGYLLEDGEVEGETESDGMRRGELGDGNIGSGLVSLERLVGRVLSLVTSGKLGKVSVVISHPMRRISMSDQDATINHLATYILW